MGADGVLRRRFMDVGPNRRPIGDRLGVYPRLEVVAEGVHVAVGANAGIAKQVPGAADGVAPLQNGEGPIRALPPQMAGGPNTGNPGADDDDVIMLNVRTGHASTSSQQQKRRDFGGFWLHHQLLASFCAVGGVMPRIAKANKEAVRILKEAVAAFTDP